MPATATIFTEPDGAVPRTSISRQDSSSHGASCRRPIIRLGPKINTITSPITQHPFVKKMMSRVERVQEKFSARKMAIYDQLRISCLLPRLLHPFQPIFSYVRCKLGLDDDGYMEAARCGEMRCQESLEEKTITRDIGPAPMPMMDLKVKSMSDCFIDMREIKYGARVLVKIIDDEPCSNPEYSQQCEELISQDRIVEEDRCSTTR